MGQYHESIVWNKKMRNTTNNTAPIRPSQRWRRETTGPNMKVRSADNAKGTSSSRPKYNTETMKALSRMFEISASDSEDDDLLPVFAMDHAAVRIGPGSIKSLLNAAGRARCP